MTPSELNSDCPDQRHISTEYDRAHALRSLPGMGLLCSLLMIFPSQAAPPVGSGAPASTSAGSGQSTGSRISMTVGNRRFAITLANTEAAHAFAAMLPLTIDMPDLNGNEKHADLPKGLPTSAIRPGAIRSGDLMLYGSTTLVLFYLTFDSPYSYTRLGRVEDASGLAETLGRRGARIEFSR